MSSCYRSLMSNIIPFFSSSSSVRLSKLHNKKNVCFFTSSTTTNQLIGGPRRNEMNLKECFFLNSKKTFITNQKQQHQQPHQPQNCRRFFSSESVKLHKAVTNEIQYEKTHHKTPTECTEFIKSGVWTFEEKENDVNMILKRTVEGKKVTVEFQLVSPFQPESEENENNSEMNGSTEMTDFSVTVEKPDGSGLTLYCSTLLNDEKFRFMIGNVRYFKNVAEKDSAYSYNGPEFDDLDSNVQQGLDEWLCSLGVDTNLCDFIDKCAVDKEHREYISWLNSIGNFFKE